MSEYMAQQMDRQIEGAQETYKSMCEEIEQLRARVALTEKILNEAFARMDRGRNILTKGCPTPMNNWGIFDTKYLREELAAPQQEQENG
jgi:hypothetical protein